MKQKNLLTKWYNRQEKKRKICLQTTVCYARKGKKRKITCLKTVQYAREEKQKSGVVVF